MAFLESQPISGVYTQTPTTTTRHSIPPICYVLKHLPHPSRIIQVGTFWAQQAIEQQQQIQKVVWLIQQTLIHTLAATSPPLPLVRQILLTATSLSPPISRRFLILSYISPTFSSLLYDLTLTRLSSDLHRNIRLPTFIKAPSTAPRFPKNPPLSPLPSVPIYGKNMHTHTYLLLGSHLSDLI